MKNEEKAKRIALDKQSGTSSGFLETYLIAYESAMSMAEWKDKLIDKACERLSHRIFNCGEGNLINDFKKAMEEEQ